LIQRKDYDGLRPYVSPWLIPWITTMIIELLSREHRNIERLLAVLEHELDIFDRADRPDYEVIRAIIAYFEVYTELYHHPQEDQVFARLKQRDPAVAAGIGDLAREHQTGSERLRRVAQTIDSVLAGREILRENVDAIVRDFLEHERHHLAMEDCHFFPAAAKALKPDDWAEIASAQSTHKDPLFSDATETRFDALCAHIFQLEQEAESERH
jgi:hemerythrin-like domain-containing protein